MDLDKHYASYKTAVTYDALDNYVEHAKLNKVDEPLRRCVKNLQEAIAYHDVPDYRQYLQEHQRRTLLLFCDMARKLTLTEALNRGPGWYKFTNYVVRFTNCVWIPRYSREHVGRHVNDVKLDSQEVSLLSQPGAPVAVHVLARKRQDPYAVFTDTGFVDYRTQNEHTVRDWTAELFA